MRRPKRRFKAEMISDHSNCRRQRIPSRFLRDLDGFCRDNRCKICSKKLPSLAKARRAVLHNLAIAEELAKNDQERKVIDGIQELLGSLWNEHYWEWCRTR